MPRLQVDQHRPSLITLTVLSIFILYVQLFLGANVSPSRNGLVSACDECAAGRACAGLDGSARPGLYAKIEAVRRPANLLLILLITQLCLGYLAFLTRVAWGHEAVQPEFPMVMSTVAHVAVGALLLATAVVLAIQVWRHVPVSFEERVPGERGKAGVRRRKAVSSKSVVE